ncbi:MAG: hypothetical protein R3F20_12535 [Planctomycetota bacterium]
MPRCALIGVLGLALALATACESSGGNKYEESWEDSYDHSFDFLWEEAQASITQYFPIAVRDVDNRRLVSDWDTSLGYFSGQGRRTRITVEFEEIGPSRFRMKVSEETQENTEQINPTVASEASWEATESDGAAASRFRINFERRINPPERWRDEAEKSAEGAGN